MILSTFVFETVISDLDADKLWLFNEDKSSSPNYLYELNENDSGKCNSSDNTVSLQRQDDNHFRELEDRNKSTRFGQEDLETEDSTARISLESNYFNDTTLGVRADKDDPNQQAKKVHLGSGSGTSSKQNNQDKSNQGNKKTTKVNSFFSISPAKKISFTSLLPKSKKPLDNQRTTTKSQPAHKVSQTNLMIEPRGLTNQRSFTPLTGSHLLFGAHTQLPLPAYYSNHPGHFFNHFAPRPGDPIATGQTIPHAYHQSASHYAHPMDIGKQGELAPIFYPAVGPTRPRTNKHQSQQQRPNNNHDNRTRSNDSSNQGQSNSNQHPLSSLPIGVAAAALLSERAKSFISQLNRGATTRSPQVAKNNNNNQAGNSNLRNTNRDTSSANNNNVNNNQGSNGNNHGSYKGSASNSDNIGLASMIKNAADAWSVTNPGSEPSQSIIVEHDGPSLTTVDFNANMPPQLMGPQPPFQGQRAMGNDAPEDDETSSFYEEETEVGGSHQAKRIAKMRHPHPFYPQHQQQHHNQRHPHQGHELHNSYQPHHYPHQPPPPQHHHMQHHHHAQRMPVEQQVAPQRFPFEQQVQSHEVQTEVPMDTFYNTMEPEFNQRHHKKPIEETGLGQDALQDYLRLQKMQIDSQNQQFGNYPDSINAIKELNNGGAGGGENKVRDLAATISSKLSASSNNPDQIDQLIKELQNMNKGRQHNEDQASSNSGARRPPKGILDDYDELLSNDDEEDEQIKLLRKKLLQRLRGKYKKNNRDKGSGSSESSFQSEAIKIPLHALLLAALDRRMSPSEQSQTVSPDSSSTDDKNRDVSTTTVGPKLQILSETNSAPGATNQLPGANPFFDPLFDGTAKSDQVPFENGTELYQDNLSYDPPPSNTDPTPPPSNKPEQHLERDREYQAPNMFILNNIRLPDHLNLQKGQNESAATVLTVERAQHNGGKVMQNSSSNQETPSPRQMDEPIYVQQTTRRPLVVRRNDRQLTSREQQESTKRRRHLANRHDDSGDFDMNKQVVEFAQERAQVPYLGPDWGVRVKDEQSNKPIKKTDSSVHFDDDFEEMARSTRRKILKRRRRPPKTSDDLDKIEDGFFNKVQRDTSDQNTDIEKNISSIEEASGSAPAEKRSSKRDRERIDEGIADEDDAEMDSNDISQQQIMDEEEVGNGQKSNRGSRTSGSREWKPQMIEDEVRRIEDISRNKRSHSDAKDEPGSSASGENQDYSERPEDAPPQMLANEAAEPCGDSIPTSARPAV